MHVGATLLVALLAACAGAAPRHRSPLALPLPDDLGALILVHREPTPMPPGPLTIPLDWRTLPQSAVLWAATEPYPFANVALPDALATLEDHRIVLRDAETGVPRWSAALSTDATGNVSFLADQGVILSFEADGVHARALSDGRDLWALAGAALAEEAALISAGRLALRLDHGDVIAPREVVVLRVADGTALRTRVCPGSCHLVAFDGEELVVEDDGRFLRARLDDVEWAPARDAALGPGLVEVRELAAEIVSGPALTMRDRSSGGVRWSTPLPGEASWQVVATDERRVLLLANTPPLIIDVDAGSGVVAAMRVAPIFGTVSVALRGDRAYLAGYRGTVAVDLSREAPAVREVQSLEADVLATLANPHARLPWAGGISWTWDHPWSGGSPQEWLHRLRPLIEDLLVQRLRIETGERAALLLETLGPGRSADVEAIALDHLRATFGWPASAETVAVRHAALRVLEDTALSSEDQALLVESTSAWLEALQPMGALEPLRAGACFGDDRPRACRISLPVVEIAQWVEHRLAAARAWALLDRMRDVAARLGGADSAPASSCTPTDDDLVLVEAVRAGGAVLLGPAVVALPANSCVAICGLFGSVIIVPSGDTSDEPDARYATPTREPPSWLETSSVGPGAEGAGAGDEVRWVESSDGYCEFASRVESIDGRWRVTEVVIRRPACEVE